MNSTVSIFIDGSLDSFQRYSDTSMYYVGNLCLFIPLPIGHTYRIACPARANYPKFIGTIREFEIFEGTFLPAEIYAKYTNSISSVASVEVYTGTMTT